MPNKFVGIYIFKVEISSFMYGTAALRPIFISSAKGSKSISGVTLEITLRSENWSEPITIWTWVELTIRASKATVLFTKLTSTAFSLPVGVWSFSTQKLTLDWTVNYKVEFYSYT